MTWSCVCVWTAQRGESVQIEFLAKLSDCRAFWTDGTLCHVARGMRFWPVGLDMRPCGSAHVLGGIEQRLLASFRPVRQFLRMGIHHLWPLSDGAFLVFARKRVVRVASDGSVADVAQVVRGNKPAHRGVCVAPDGTILFGEYALNFDRSMPISLYRSDDHGISFRMVHEFAAGVVRHIHFVQWDPYAECLWMGTGDSDRECLLFRSVDRGLNWDEVGGGSQLWRAVGLAFTADAIYWGTDAGSDAGMHPNYVMRLDRATMSLGKVMELQGPCHGNASMKDGTLVVSTGVEGGRNEKDRRAHLWASRDGVTWNELISYRKDLLPHIVQYGVIRLPNGLERSDVLIYTCLGLLGAGERTYAARLTD